MAIQFPTDGTPIAGTNLTSGELETLRTDLGINSTLIKQLYDANPDTNTFTDADKLYIDGLSLYANADLPNVNTGTVDAVNRLAVENGSFASTLYQGVFEYDSVNMVVYYGQSLSEGAYCVPCISTSQPYSNITFDSGVRTRDASGNYVAPTSFTPLIETDLTATLGETPCSGTGNALSAQLVAAGKTAANYVFLSSTAGRGGQPIGVLQVGTADWIRLINQVTAGYTLAAASNKGYSVLSLNWFQGEADLSTTPSTYATLLGRMAIAFQRLAAALTGKNYSAPLIAYQVSDGAVVGTRGSLTGLALAIAANPGLIYCSFPKYAFSNSLNGNALMNADDVHFTSIGSMLAGSKQAEIIKRIVIDGNKNWLPLSMLSATVAGVNVYISFNIPNAPLVIDTTLIPAITGNGFKVTDTTGTLTVSSVTVVNDTKVQIVCNRALTGTVTINYGLDYNYTGYTTSNAGAGNLRDSDSFGVNYNDGGGSDFYPLYNWCISSSITTVVS